MKRVLVTGARAPVALDLARQFYAAGCEVYAADSVRMPPCRVSRQVRQTFVVSEPRRDPRAFIDDLARLITLHQIDLLLPTCEEIFYVARFRDRLPADCRVVCAGFELVAALHNKFEFIQRAKPCLVRVPDTVLLEERAQVEPFLDCIEDWVFKPVYSRFASFTLVGGPVAKVRALQPSRTVPWVAQQRIRGREFCTYSVANDGNLHAHACYHPRYRLKQSSGVYFEPQNHQGVEDFVRSFVARYRFTGQIGFDFIETPQQALYVLECNPRATSGAHLFAGDGLLAQVLAGAPPQTLVQADGIPRMLAPVMLGYNLPKVLVAGGRRQFLKDYRRAKQAGHTRLDPLPSYYQFGALFEVVGRSLKRRISLKDAATADIEWNGEPL